MNTAGREKKEKYRAIPGCSCYPGVCRLPDGYEFALEVPRGSKASLILYGKEEEKLGDPPSGRKQRRRAPLCKSKGDP